MQKIILSVMLLIFSSNVSAAELFQGLETGSSISQIQQKFPNLVRDANFSIPEGYDDRLVLNSYKIYGENFRVLFLMNNKKLKQVLLAKEGNQPGEFSLLYSQILGSLTMKYGIPDASYDGLAEWDYNDIEIVLVDTSDKLYISYSTTTSDNAEKL